MLPARAPALVAQVNPAFDFSHVRQIPLLVRTDDVLNSYDIRRLRTQAKPGRRPVFLGASRPIWRYCTVFSAATRSVKGSNCGLLASALDMIRLYFVERINLRTTTTKISVMQLSLIHI